MEKEIIKKRILHGLQWLCGHWDGIVTVSLGLCLAAAALWAGLQHIPEKELARRMELVQAAEGWVGVCEADGSHRPIIDLYNSAPVLPRGYAVTYEDSWCATFVTAMAMEAGLTHLIPAECSCQQQIYLLEEMGIWREDERYLPQPGDLIYYSWDETDSGDCTAWSNHVGIVAETFGPVARVIEGNKDDSVTYRYVFLNDLCIRGYGLPDYTQ